MNRSRPLLAAMLALALTAPLVVPTAASGATLFGSNLGRNPTLNTNCTLSCTTANVALTQANRIGGDLTSPSTGTVTSFSVRSGSTGSISLKILRPTSVATYTGVGTSSPVPIGTGITGPIPVFLPIRRGDTIGLDNPGAHLVLAANGGATQVYYTPPLLNGATLTGATAGGLETMVQATVEPSNVLEFGALSRNKKRGNARLTLTIPNAGTLRTSGNDVGVSIPGGSSVRAGTTTVKVRARDDKSDQLEAKGRTSVAPVFTYTPSSGLTNVQSTSFKLFLKRKKK